MHHKIYKQYDDNDYTESSTSSNAEKSPDTNQMLNDLGLGDSNAVDKSNESNDTANDQDNDINTSQVSESDLIDREGDIENNEENDENLEVEDDIIYVETVEATNTDYVNCGASTSRGRIRGRGRGGKTTINSAYYFSNEYLKTVKDEPIEGCINNTQIRNNKSSEKVQNRYSKRLRDQN
jgi:hypothetical protein